MGCGWRSEHAPERGAPRSGQHQPTGPHGPVERVEHEAQDLQRHHAEEWFVIALTKDDGRMSVALRQTNVALRHIALDHGPALSTMNRTVRDTPCGPVTTPSTYISPIRALR